MIFISEKRGRPVGSKNKPKGDISMPNELTKEEQRIFDILSTFAQKGFVDFTLGAVDNEKIMQSEDQELISLYSELVSTVKNRGKGFFPKVIFKLYNTFSNMDVLSRSAEFGQYLRDQGYEFSTVDDVDIPKDQIKKHYKDFSVQSPEPEPKPEKSPEQKSSEEIKATLIRTLYNFSLLSKYLKEDLNLDDNEIKSRIITLLSPAGTKTPNDTEGSQSSLNEQILRDFKRFL